MIDHGPKVVRNSDEKVRCHPEPFALTESSPQDANSICQDGIGKIYPIVCQATLP